MTFLKALFADRAAPRHLYTERGSAQYAKRGCGRRLCKRGAVAAAEFQRGVEDRADGKDAGQFVVRDRRQAHGGHTSAGAAIRIASKLAGRNLGPQIGRNRLRGKRKDTGSWAVGWRLKLADQRRRHVELGIMPAELEHFGDGAGALGGREHFGQRIADLRREHAEPDPANLGSGRPQIEEVAEITGALHHLTCHRAMDGDVLPGDVFENAIVGCRSAAGIMFGGQAVDGHDNVETRQICPVASDGAEGAGHNLHVNAATEQLRDQSLHLAISHQRIAADERKVERVKAIDDFQHAVDESLSPAIIHFAERYSAA